MITKMTKYSFILLSGEKDGFLEQLQELGIVDISRSVKPVDQDSHLMFARATKAKKTIVYLRLKACPKRSIPSIARRVWRVLPRAITV